MRFDWDPRKDASNQRKHGVGFGDASTLFTSGVEYLEIFDELHSITEDRFIAIGPIDPGVIVVVFTEETSDTTRTAKAVQRYHEHMEAL